MAEHLTTTPSGIEILFEDGLPDPETGKAKRRQYLCNGEKLTSVTTVLACLDKAGLKYAAEKLGVEGAIELAQRGELPMNVDGALSRMKSEGLRFWQRWAAKADRGAVAHEDLVGLVTGQATPELDSYPPDSRGMIQGVSGWVADDRPTITEAEVMVASIEHRFAGRHDLFGTLPAYGDRRLLLDLKTTAKLPRYKGGGIKPPYPEMLLQLAGYEIARRESGYEPSDLQGVLRVDAEGAYDLFVTVVDPASFLAVLGAYNALRGVPTKPLEAAAA